MSKRDKQKSTFISELDHKYLSKLSDKTGIPVTSLLEMAIGIAKDELEIRAGVIANLKGNSHR